MHHQENLVLFCASLWCKSDFWTHHEISNPILSLKLHDHTMTTPLTEKWLSFLSELQLCSSLLEWSGLPSGFSTVHTFYNNLLIQGWDFLFSSSPTFLKFNFWYLTSRSVLPLNNLPRCLHFISSNRKAVNWVFISIFCHQREKLVRKTPEFQSPSGSNSNSALQENTISSPLLAPCSLIVHSVPLFQHHKSLIIVANCAISTTEGNNLS